MLLSVSINSNLVEFVYLSFVLCRDAVTRITVFLRACIVSCDPWIDLGRVWFKSDKVSVDVLTFALIDRTTLIESVFVLETIQLST